MGDTAPPLASATVEYSDLEILRIELREFPPDSRNFKIHIRTFFRYDRLAPFQPGKGCTIPPEDWGELKAAVKRFDQQLKGHKRAYR